MTAEQRRILALDLGDVRIGVALSDPLRITAQPLEPLRRVGPRKDLAAVARLIEQHGAETVVIGLPLLLSGDEGPRAAMAREFAAGLERRLQRIRIVLWDERFTTVEAERAMIADGVRRAKRRDVVDGLAAVLILQSFIEATYADVE